MQRRRKINSMLLWKRPRGRFESAPNGSWRPEWAKNLKNDLGQGWQKCEDGEVDASEETEKSSSFYNLLGATAVIAIVAAGAFLMHRKGQKKK